MKKLITIIACAISYVLELLLSIIPYIIMISVHIPAMKNNVKIWIWIKSNHENSFYFY